MQAGEQSDNSGPAIQLEEWIGELQPIRAMMIWQTLVACPNLQRDRNS